jgi:shikimate 5-dehydrogenase
MHYRRGGGKEFMGDRVEMIDKETLLFALIGESAIESGKAKLFNDNLNDMDVNAKMMPLNIRMDDIGFFLHNFKDSQIKAGYFQKEFWEVLYNLLDEMSDEARVCGIIDTMDVSDGKNYAYVMQGRAVVSLLEVKDKTVGIYGDNKTIKSIIYNLNSSGVKEVILYDDVIEKTLDLSKIMPDLNVDIVRVDGDTLESHADIFIDGRGDREVDTSSLILDLNIEEKVEDKLTFYDIEKEIAKIKTKEWVKDG